MSLSELEMDRRTLILLGVTTALTLAGCDTESSITAPVEPTPTLDPNKTAFTLEELSTYKDTLYASGKVVEVASIGDAELIISPAPAHVNYTDIIHGKQQEQVLPRALLFAIENKDISMPTFTTYNGDIVTILHRASENNQQLKVSHLKGQIVRVEKMIFEDPNKKQAGPLTAFMCTQITIGIP